MVIIASELLTDFMIVFTLQTCISNYGKRSKQCLHNSKFNCLADLITTWFIIMSSNCSQLKQSYNKVLQHFRGFLFWEIWFHPFPIKKDQLGHKIFHSGLFVPCKYTTFKIQMTFCLFTFAFKIKFPFKIYN